jgi:hypothetical protein
LPNFKSNLEVPQSNQCSQAPLASFLLALDKAADIIEAAIDGVEVGMEIVHNLRQIRQINGEGIAAEEVTDLRGGAITTAAATATEAIVVIEEVDMAIDQNEENQKAGMMTPFRGTCSVQRSRRAQRG